MTLEEYLDAARFPETTQDGLEPAEQLMIDSYNFDQLKEYLDEGNQPSPSQAKTWEELQVKMKDNKRLAAELAQSAKAKKA